MDSSLLAKIHIYDAWSMDYDYQFGWLGKFLFNETLKPIVFTHALKRKNLNINIVFTKKQGAKKDVSLRLLQEGF